MQESGTSSNGLEAGAVLLAFAALNVHDLASAIDILVRHIPRSYCLALQRAYPSGSRCTA